MKKENTNKSIFHNKQNDNLQRNTISRRQALIAMSAASGAVLIPDIEKIKPVIHNAVNEGMTEKDISNLINTVLKKYKKGK